MTWTWTPRRCFALALVAASAITGCGSRGDDCKLNGNCGGAASTGSDTGAGNPQGGGGSGAGGSTSSGANCAGDPKEQNIVESCAIFVASGAVGKAGTRKEPIGNLAVAITKAASSGKRVYACGDFEGPLAPVEHFDLWGGFKCDHSQWTWLGTTRSALTADADLVPLIADVTGTAEVHAFSITAKAATETGGSSIGVVFGKRAEATVDRCTVTASDAKANGTSPGTPDTGKDALAPTPGTEPSCNTSTVATGNKLTCDNDASTGGDGGNGGTASSQDGGHGGGGILDGANLNNGGAGQPEASGSCGPGGVGPAGAPGTAGNGGLANDTNVDIATNGDDVPTGAVTIAGGVGKAGGAGHVGAPGGGGGGGKHTPSCRGGLGGGGASGSCGGGGGFPGLPGGSSIGVVCLGSRLSMNQVLVTVGTGGAGGPGGGGGTGGVVLQANDVRLNAITSFNGTSIGCKGGVGGLGGTGGTGGGGRGGHSLGVALFAAAPQLTLGPTSGWTLKSAGDPGTTDASATPADHGEAGACWNFALGTECH